MSIPPARETEMVSARFPAGEGRRMAEVAAQLGVSRSELIRQSIRATCVELRLTRQLIESEEFARR